MSRDARKLKPVAQRELRRQAIEMLWEGVSRNEIAKRLSVHPSTVTKWKNAYKGGGMESLEVKKRGPKVGVHKTLTPKEQKLIKKLIVDKRPEQIKMEFALWTREAVQQLIYDKTGHRLHLSQVGRYLKEWGFTVQRPAKSAYQRDDEKVKEWLEETYPQIQAQAKKEGAEIHWADEVGVKSHQHRGAGYAPKGQTPIRKHNPAWEKVNMISSVTNQGKLRFMCYDGKFTYQVFHQFLKGLLKEAKGRKLHIIVDNLRVHHAKVIKRWCRLMERKGLLQMHYLPSYTPDLNPDEYLNCDLKTQLSKKPERREKGQWRETVEQTMQELQNSPERIKNYFQAKPIQYAA